MSTVTFAELHRTWTRWLSQRGKTSIFPRKQRKRLISVTGAHNMNRVLLCFFESKHCSFLDRIRKRREQRCSLLAKAKKQRMERERAIGDYEAMLNSNRRERYH